MQAWTKSNDEDLDLLDKLAYVLHASKETVLPHVGHFELASMPRFLDAIAKRYTDMGSRCKDEVSFVFLAATKLERLSASSLLERPQHVGYSCCTASR
eukprot:6485425-Amphidinium_carterae.1